MQRERVFQEKVLNRHQQLATFYVGVTGNQSDHRQPFATSVGSFQFLGIPPKGEHSIDYTPSVPPLSFPISISRDPPEGGTVIASFDGSTQFSSKL